MTFPWRPVLGNQHDREIHENLEAWKRKPLLREVYRDFHRLLARYVVQDREAVTLELGSGIGSIKETLPDCMTSDMFPNPWLDRLENAYALSWGAGTVTNLILFDVWHHLQYPGTALKEFARVLRPRGRLLLLDPDMGLLGRVIYGLLHHEPLGCGGRIAWNAPNDFDPKDAPYFAAQASAHRIFYRRENTGWMRDWSLVHLQRMASLTYVASGGFRGPQLYPARLLPYVRMLDGAFSHWPKMFATRILIVLERKAEEPTPATMS